MQYYLKRAEYIPSLSFDFLTRYYDWIMKKVMPGRFREILVQHISPSPGDYILDFGTGTAEIAIHLKKTTPSIKITALDIDPKALKIAKAKLRKEDLDVHIIEYDGTLFPFPSNYFDKVVSCLVFHHLSPEQKRHALAEIFRVLKPGGKVYIADWGLERNKIKAKLLNLFKYSNSLKHIVEHGKGLFPGYLVNARFECVTESGHLKTKTGTLCYYEAHKKGHFL